jgi:ABC-type sugar transport system substrate-binding protein
MKTSRTIIAAAGAALVALSLTACGGGGGASDADQMKLGFITKYNNDFFLTMQDAVKTWDQGNADVEVILGQGANEHDVDGQIRLIESMVTQQVDGIAIAPVSEGVQPALEAAVAQGINVILVDNDLPEFDNKTSVVATDNYQGGKLAGEWLATELATGDTVAVLTGVPGVPALDDRTDGMIEGLGGQFEVVQQVPTDCAQEKGVSGTEDILSAHPDVDAIYAACGPPVLGAIEALKNANVAPDQLLLVGFDALPDEAEAILAGNEDATVAQFPAKMGTMSLDALVATSNDEQVEPVIDTGTEIVTKKNAAQFTG